MTPLSMWSRTYTSVSRCALAAWACCLMACCTAQYPLLPKRVCNPSTSLRHL